MPKTMTFVANVILHLMEMKQEVFTQCVNLQFSFIDLCDSCDEDGTLAISFCPFESSLQMSFFPFAFVDSPYFNTKIPYVVGPYVLNVIDCLRKMSLATHANSKLGDLNYDHFHIEIVPFILTTFSGDVLFEHIKPFCQSQRSFWSDAKNGQET